MLLAIGTVALMGVTAAAADPPLLVATPPIPMERTKGWFDYLVVDAQQNRLLAAHAGNDELAILSLKDGSLLKRVSTGSSRGVAVDARDWKYFVGTADSTVAVVDRRSMTLSGQIKLPGPVDAIAFDPKNDTLYADEGGGTHVWAINGKSEKLVGDISIPGDPEYVEYDPVTDRIYQNIVTPPEVVVIDPQTNAMIAAWNIAPAIRPHGLAVDGQRHRLFTAGVNGKLTVLDTRTGNLIGVVDIPERVDQVVADPSTGRVYGASGTGQVAVVSETDAGAALTGSVNVPRGTHTLTVDPKTHTVWIAYGGEQSDYLMKLTQP
jgi:DNA-binding beta-propeller fold protein YncE